MQWVVVMISMTLMAAPAVARMTMLILIATPVLTKALITPREGRVQGITYFSLKPAALRKQKQSTSISVGFV
jgi:hypothetical protein